MGREAVQETATDSPKVNDTDFIFGAILFTFTLGVVAAFSIRCQSCGGRFAHSHNCPKVSLHRKRKKLRGEREWSTKPS